MITLTLRITDIPSGPSGPVMINFSRDFIYRGTLYLFLTSFRLMPLNMGELKRDFRRHLFRRWGFRRTHIPYTRDHLQRLVILGLDASCEINFDPRDLHQHFHFHVRLESITRKIYARDQGSYIVFRNNLRRLLISTSTNYVHI